MRTPEAPPVQEHTNRSFEVRLNRIEAEFTSLVQELRRSESSRSDWEARVENKLDSITSRKTDWGVIISGITAILLIGGLSYKPMYDNIERTERQLAQFKDQSEADHINMGKSVDKEIKNTTNAILRELDLKYTLGKERDHELAVWLTVIDKNGPRNLNKEIYRELYDSERSVKIEE